MKNFNLAGPGGIPALKQLPSDGTVTAPGTWVFPGNVTVTGTLASGAESVAAETITSTSANALAVGPAGTTNPTFNVDASTASAATGLSVKSAAAAAGVALTVISSGTNENMTINAKGSGTITLQSVATGAVVINSRIAVSGAQTSIIAAGRQGSTNPAFQVDSSVASSVTGVKVTAAAAAGGVAVAAISSGTDESMTIDAKGSGTITLNGTGTGNIVLGRATTGVSFSGTGTLTARSGTAPAAGGTAGGHILLSSTANLGIFLGSGAPSASAAQGSIYMRTDGSSTSTRLYVNTDGGTTWTNVTTAA